MDKILEARTLSIKSFNIFILSTSLISDLQDELMEMYATKSKGFFKALLLYLNKNQTQKHLEVLFSYINIKYLDTTYFLPNNPDRFQVFNRERKITAPVRNKALKLPYHSK